MILAKIVEIANYGFDKLNVKQNYKTINITTLTCTTNNEQKIAPWVSQQYKNYTNTKTYTIIQQ